MEETKSTRTYIPHTPTPRQAEFLALDCLEAFYGGAAGGGKSDALLMAALRYVDAPGYAAILFRRTYQDLALPGALMDRASHWLAGSDASWNGTTRTWTFPGGATLSFGYLAHEQDKFRYQGAEFQFVGFDELTQFSESAYRYLFSRLRRLAGSAVPLRMRGASNPGGLGHAWVKQRFLVEGQAAGRPFIPARLSDNPHLDREEYEKSLLLLDPTTRQQLLDGDWDARPPGKKFRREWFEIVKKAPRQLRWSRFWDLASTEPKSGRDPDWTVGLLLGEARGEYWIADIRRARLNPGGVERLIRQTAIMDTPRVEICIEQEPGSSGKSLIWYYQTHVLQGFAVYGIRATGSKETRANPVSAAAQAGLIHVVEGPWLGELFDELEVFPGGAHDDQVDALSGAFAKIAGSGSRLSGDWRGSPRLSPLAEALQRDRNAVVTAKAKVRW